ncbi:unnamed protein product [Chilo suppressalis]|uniref:FAM21/CAPZIP domain-containing protein n=1 Tax=Chilo suppressalis TaxID=168631 RepID=A0ABN8BCN5_CHISP|nr:unnamed protein product [Chilo suppressalis]
MEKKNTAALRNAAAEWSLAGDKQLLDILQNIHQSLMTKCQEVNQRLDEMVTALDDASVDLQNVNNKFMALSNTQFIESRVYDDDLETTVQQTTKNTAPPPPQELSELDSIIQSVKALENAHEAIQIVGSDSESDTDSEGTSVVLKPKDMYGSRPLPHIIGSAPWRNKWHAGLIVDDSDTDSVTSKPETAGEVYSDSEPDIDDDEIHDYKHPAEITGQEAQGSTTSSEMFSEQDSTPIAASKPTPSDVAAELHRRLRGHAELPQVDTDFTPSQPTTRKIYKPEQPTAGTIFSDEPPPFEGYQSEGEQYSQDEDDDIFAELQKNKPNNDSNKVRSRVAEDLFGGFQDDRGDLFDDIVGAKPPSPPVAKQKSTLFEDESEPELFASKPVDKPIVIQRNDPPDVESVKKPIGGISLFGSNKGAESIGAAILRRNRRKSSSDEDDNTMSEEMPKPRHEQTMKAAEKDIFDDLFAKSEREQKIAKEKKEVTKVTNTQGETKKVDLFSDNLFDDIDNIFASDVVKVSSKSNEKPKSLFDDDDDDLFADIAVSETTKREVKVESKNKSIFDSDDDLFSENVVKSNVKSNVLSGTVNYPSVNKTNDSIKDSRSVFNNSNSNISSNLNKNKFENTVISSAAQETNNKNTKNTISQSENRKPDIINTLNNNNNKSDKCREKVGLMFDDDDNDSDDIFSNTNKNTTITHEKHDNSSTSVNPIEKVIAKNEIKTTKISILDDDNLFTGSSEPSKSTVEEAVKSSNEVNSKSNSYNVFDTSSKETDKTENIAQNNNTKEKTETNSPIFGDDSDNSDEFLFSNNNKKSSNNIKSNTSIKPVDSTPSESNVNKSSLKSETKSDNNLNNDNNILENKIEKGSPDHGNLNVSKESIKPEIPETDFESCSNDISIDIPQDNTESDSFLNAVKDAIFNTSDDIFNDIMDEPPAFEKTKEPKKSKNVNALFDDDSDDEALFFKKNDVTYDEKLDDDDISNSDQMFGVFHSEPPAIDIDFTHNVDKKAEKGFLGSDSDDDLFQIKGKVKPDSKKVTENSQKSVENSKDVFNDGLDDFPITNVSSKPFISDGKQSESNKVIANDNFFNTSSSKALKQNTVTATDPIQKETASRSDTDLKTEVLKDKTHEQTNLTPGTEAVKPTSDKPLPPKYEAQTSDTPDSPESKKVGKLKNMNFNIDVSTLLPGASPKKKIVEQVDGQILSAKSQEDFHQKDNIEHTIVKAVSFEGEPDSQILDNKLSKERAKIQVKRRPSTRRARKEAARKSVLVLGEDSTDNSSSFDDAPSLKDDKSNNEHNQKNKDRQNPTKVEHITRIEQETEVSLDYEANVIDSKSDELKSSLYEKVKANERLESSSKTQLNNKIDIEADTKILKNDENKTVKSKVVYILNDEDIFNSPVEKPAVKPNKVLNIVDDDDDDLFRNLATSSKTVEPKSAINTLGNVYNQTKIAEKEKRDANMKKSIFDDLSEDENELFNAKTKVVKPKSILDSDSEDDLFGGKKVTKEKPVSVKEMADVKSKIVVKPSLFGDEDDDGDDLFGAKTKVDTATSSLPVKQTAKDVVSKTPEPVLNDPLSLLSEDD